jgi:hypothetical protein
MLKSAGLNGTPTAFTTCERSKQDENQDEHQRRPPQGVSKYLKQGPKSTPSSFAFRSVGFERRAWRRRNYGVPIPFLPHRILVMPYCPDERC